MSDRDANQRRESTTTGRVRARRGPGSGSGHWAASVPLEAGVDTEATVARLWAAGAEGVWERPDELVGYFRSPPEEVDREGPLALPDETTWSHAPEVDHVAAWRATARPVRAGGVEIVPHHLADEHTTPDGLHRIVLDPGQAFGSGHHATTSGCLDALAELDPSGRRVLDLGTGSGILAIAACLHGAARVLAVDTDPHAVAVARTNATNNGVAPELAVATLADLDDTFDLVLANLLTTTLIELAGDLPLVLEPDGWLVASGASKQRAHLVANAFTQAGLADVSIRPRDDWAILLARAPGPGRSRTAESDLRS